MKYITTLHNSKQSQYLQLVLGVVFFFISVIISSLIGVVWLIKSSLMLFVWYIRVMFGHREKI